MQTTTIHHNNKTIIEVQHPITSEADGLEVLNDCANAATDRVLLPAGALGDDFFNLRTGLAGAVLGKFALYRMKAAAVLPPEQAGAGRFGEMVLEANRGTLFHVYASREEALDWLSGD